MSTEIWRHNQLVTIKFSSHAPGAILLHLSILPLRTPLKTDNEFHLSSFNSSREINTFVCCVLCVVIGVYHLPLLWEP